MMRCLASIVAVCFGLLALTGSGPAIANVSQAAAVSLPPPPCPITHPNGHAVYGMTPGPGLYGNDALATAFVPDGIIRIGPPHVQPDGTLAMKWPWFRGLEVVGALTITGQRLDAAAPPLRAEITEGYGDKGFQATVLIFPTEGCWQVTGTVGKASLTFVVHVVKVP